MAPHRFPAISFAIVIATMLLNVETVLAGESSYVGANECAQCHKQQHEEWRESDHYQAMLPARPDTVLGDFSNHTVTFHGVTSRLFEEGGVYYIENQDAGGEVERYVIRYTFGHFPLQQYLVELEDGFLQALNVAWDSRPAEQGGQRWFHLQPNEEITPSHPFHWKRHFQNWNSRCADCHSTNLARNYDQETHSYTTTWSEVNVACEACHGPGSAHVDLARQGQLTPEALGFANVRPKSLQWVFSEGDTIANPIGEKSSHHVDMCGMCHSLRTQLSGQLTSGYHEANRLQLLNDVSYFSDGQIREEVYVLGSFLQSKMYEQGVTCTNCHNPHSGKLLAEGNALCAQCHRAEEFDTPGHHHHQTDSEGSQCVSCHMPERTYMQVDPRRDHSFTIPRPLLSEELEVPNACTGCHLGKTNRWASEALRSWGVAGKEDHWSRLMRGATSGDILVTRPLVNMVDSDVLPALVSASLLAQLAAMPSRASIETAQRQLGQEDPMRRRAAVASLQALPIDLRWQLLSPHLEDPSRSVRFEIVDVLANGYSGLFPEQQELLDPLIAEYRENLIYSAGSPGTHVALANLELGLRNLVEAERQYLHALRIEPGYVPALINLADYYRSIGRDEEVEPLLSQALEVASDSGAANHSYGLYLVRQQDLERALPYLEAATLQEDAQARFSYVYAVALENSGDVEGAISVLEDANDRWPNQFDLLMTLVTFLEGTGRSDAVYPYISRLSAIAPNAPEVQQLMQKYAN